MLSNLDPGFMTPALAGEDQAGSGLPTLYISFIFDWLGLMWKSYLKHYLTDQRLGLLLSGAKIMIHWSVECGNEVKQKLLDQKVQVLGLRIWGHR